MPEHPVDRFLEQYVRVVKDRDEYVLMEDLHEAYCEWAAETEEEQFEQRKVSRRLRTFFDPIGKETRYEPVVGDRQQPAHRRLVMEWR